MNGPEFCVVVTDPDEPGEHDARTYRLSFFPEGGSSLTALAGEGPGVQGWIVAETPEDFRRADRALAVAFPRLASYLAGAYAETIS